MNDAFFTITFEKNSPYVTPYFGTGQGLLKSSQESGFMKNKEQ